MTVDKLIVRSAERVFLVIVIINTFIRALYDWQIGLIIVIIIILLTEHNNTAVQHRSITPITVRAYVHIFFFILISLF